MKKQALSRSCLTNIPHPDSLWNVILGFCDQYSQEIDGYANGGFDLILIRAEEQFNASAEIPRDTPALLALVCLVYRRSRYLDEYHPEQIDQHRSFIEALLQKALDINRL